MLTLDSTTATLDTDTTLDTLMPTTTERDLLMPSLRLRLMPSSIDMVPIIPMLTLDSTTDTLDTTLDTLMPTMEITDMAPVPTTATAATATVATGDTTMDKSSSRVTKQKLNANITPCKSDFSS